MPFPDQRLTRKYYSIITGMLNQQNAIVKVLTGGFSPQKERFGGFPSHAICATVHIKSTWNFMLKCMCVCVYLCVHGDLFLSHTLACKTLHTQKRTLGAVSSISAVKPDPPQLFSLVIMSKFAQEGRGKGRAMWTCVGVFWGFFWFFCFFLQNPLLITADLRRPRSKSPSEAFQTFKHGARKTFSSLSFFPTESEDLFRERGRLSLPDNKYINYKCKECREKSSLVESLEGNW